jgi:hypothetical protein
LWFTPVQCLEGVYDATGLTPESGFIAAKAIKCEIRQIGEPQKAAGELERRGIRVRLGIVPAKDGVNNVAGIGK